MLRQASSSEIRVAVVFGPDSGIRPVWFELNRRRHDVQSITNSWRHRCGETLQIHFHVTDGGALFELIFNPLSATWQIIHIEAI